MRRRFPAPPRRSPVGIRHLVVLVALVLLTASGTAFTAGMDDVPRTSVDLQTPAYYTASNLEYTDEGGLTVAHFRLTGSQPGVPAQQVQARVRSTSPPGGPVQTCSASVTDQTQWTCPVPVLTVDEARAGTFAYTAR